MTPVEHNGIDGFPLRLLAELPRGTTFELAVGDAPVFLTTSRAHAEVLVRAGSAVCTPLEYELLAVALADGRCTRVEAAAELAAKVADPQHRITRERVLGPVVAPDGGGDRWTVGELLRALDARLVRVLVEESEATP